MSKKRQSVLRFDPPRDKPGDVTTLSYDFPNRHTIEEHVHDEGQLVHAVSGVMTVRTRKGTWVVPTERAVWVPGRLPHAIDMSGAVTMKTLYLAPRLARRLPRTCGVIHVSPLLRELIVRACTSNTLDMKVARDARLVGLILDEVDAAPLVPLTLPNPKDARALRVSAMLIADPADPRPLAELCRAVGASKRTVERAFLAETKLSFGQWRRQLSLLTAMRLIAAGAKVSSAAVDAGYRSASAFITMFRRALGTTPGEYFKAPPASRVPR
jgi:AraC-like DNA-binding protein/quercetin dioxygenase-like cupin family protein